MKSYSKKSWAVMAGIILLTFIFLPHMPPAQANPMHMDMSQHGRHGHMFKPHNAAVHFLAMAPQLKLTGKQTAHLITLRDAWIEENSVNEARLAAMRSDLQRLIMAKSIDLKAVDQMLAEISILETGLWHAFARQLHDIKAMLSTKQKQRLADMHRMKMGHAMGRHSTKH